MAVTYCWIWSQRSLAQLIPGGINASLLHCLPVFFNVWPQRAHWELWWLIAQPGASASQWGATEEIQKRYRSHGELQAFTKKHGHTQSSTHRGQNHRVYNSAYVQICICELQRSVFKAKYIVFINLINKKNLHTHTHRCRIMHHSLRQIILLSNTDAIICSTVMFPSSYSPLVGIVKSPPRPWLISARCCNWNSRYHLMRRCIKTRHCVSAISDIWVSSLCD